MSNLEELANKMISDFKDKMSIEINLAAKEVMDNLYCDMLPHIENDTLGNVNITTQDAIEKILEGDFTVSDDNELKIIDRNGVSIIIRLSPSFHHIILNRIIEVMPNCPKDIKIKQLEDRIKWLEDYAR